MVIRARAAILLIPIAWCGCALLVGLEDDHHLATDESASDAANDAAHEADVTDSAVDVTDSAVDVIDSATDADDGGQKPVVLAKGSHPSFIRADDTSVYWVEDPFEGAPGSVMKIDLAGGSPVTLAPNRQMPTGLRLTLTDVWFTDEWLPPDGGNFGLFSVAKTSDGGAPPVLVANDGQGYGDLSIFDVGNNVYFLSEAWSDAGPTRIRKTIPGQPSCYLDSAPGRIPAISANITPGYYVDEQAGDIMVTSLGCGAVATLFAKADPTARGFIRLTPYIYWASATGIYRLDENAPGGTPKLIFGGVSPAGMYTNDIGFYFTNPKDGTVRNQNTIIAKDQKGPLGIYAAANGTVFWTNHESGEIMMLAKP